MKKSWGIRSLRKVSSEPITLFIPTISFIPAPSLPTQLSELQSERLAACLTSLIDSAALSQPWLGGNGDWRGVGCWPKGFQDTVVPWMICSAYRFLLSDAIWGGYLHHRRQQTWLELICERLEDIKRYSYCFLLLIVWWIINTVVEKITQVPYRYTEDKNIYFFCMKKTNAEDSTLNEKGLVF